MFSRFFINRPIFAAVISIVFVLAGAITLMGLPISQYPTIEPPTVNVSTSYPGANAQVVADTVAAPIEQEVNGVENMLYMNSVSAADGSYSLTVTFETGTDLDMAQVLVQNRVAIALNKLPEDVKRMGVTTKKKAPNFAMAVNLVSTDGRYDDIYLTNYATLRLKDEISRVNGVGDVSIFGGGEYSMRLWLDPDKLKAHDLTVSDVSGAIQEQNIQVAAGVIGRPPAPGDQAFQYTVNVLGRLEDVEQFKNIIVKTAPGGRLVRVKDVAKVDLGAETYDIECTLNNKPCTTIMIYQLPGANLLNISENIKKLLKESSKKFPQSVEYSISYDASDVVVVSIREIIETLLIAALLVILTVYVFLQDIRATLIPSITIPVSLIATFAVMGMMGFSINTLTLFGMVLAIGIVVDDAIVVVENTARNIEQHGLSAKEAALRAMEEVTGPVVATTLVLLAVFVPTAFMGGLTGVLYKQFAITISITTLFSSINALTLSPALCALLLRPTPEKHGWFFTQFNRIFAKTTNGYMKVVGSAVRKTAFTSLLFLGLCAGAAWGLISTPTGFVPEEDQGYMMANILLPDGASLERTNEVVDRVNKIIAKTPGIKNNISLAGFSILDSASSSNMAANIIVFEPWDKRTSPETSQKAILGRLWQEFSQIQEAFVIPFLTPALPGLGLSGGFEMMVQDRSGMGLNQLQKLADEMVRDGNAQAGLTGLNTSFRANVPQLFVDIDRTKVKTLGIPLSDVFNTMQTYLGSSYVNDFNKFGRTYKVYAQAEARFRDQADSIGRLEVRNPDNQMVPLSTLIKVEETLGPQIISRYNMYPAASVKGQAGPGYSTGQALNLMSQMANQKLPSGMGFEWTGISYQQIISGSQAPFIFAIAVVFVFLVLAAQYESWKIPVPAVMSVPLALFGAMLAVMARSMDNNLYTQIGLVLLIGLSAKNAILIVEFGKDAYEKGASAVDAALEASRLRFRPILMTAFSFILGVIPLVVADGAGAGSRKALGTAVFGGMLLATVLGVVFVPPLYVVFQRLGEKRKKAKQAKAAGA